MLVRIEAIQQREMAISLMLELIFAWYDSVYLQ